MRILLNDHAGHPFQVQLSRELAKRGYHILHTYCSSVQTPHGSIENIRDDPDNFDISAVKLGSDFNRYGLGSRWRQEKELGYKLSAIVKRFKPDVVISANTPLQAQADLQKSCRLQGAKFIFWAQDLLGIGITKVLMRKMLFPGYLIGKYFQHMEKKLLKESDHVVVITSDYMSYLQRYLRMQHKVTVIENWAPIDEINIEPKINSWSKKHGLDNKFCYLYSGTLGMKHNPELLFKLALKFRCHEDVCVVVISEGLGADYLKQKKLDHGLNNLILLEFQPYDVISKVFGSADVLLSILKRDAGVFAVPSKVLTYLCANKPLLLAVPKANLAARIVIENNAGIVVDPMNESGFINAAMMLKNDSDMRISFAKNGLSYARRAFNIDRITNRFEVIIQNQINSF